MFLIVVYLRMTEKSPVMAPWYFMLTSVFSPCLLPIRSHESWEDMSRRAVALAWSSEGVDVTRHGVRGIPCEKEPAGILAGNFLKGVGGYLRLETLNLFPL